MHTVRDSVADLVVSFDAFKVSRWDNGKRWEVASLSSWAYAMLQRPEVIQLVMDNHGDVKRHSDGSDRVTHLKFDRRSDALDFLADVERMAERWSS